MELDNSFWEFADEVFPWAIEVRRQLHQNPELAGSEVKTAALVTNCLINMGLHPQTGINGYGVKAVIKGLLPGPTVALRADIDALPIHEETGLPYASQTPGVMHACGHDVHTATLLGAAKALSARQNLLPGNVVLLFQPAEEVSPEGGAKGLIAAGALKEPAVAEIYGLHVEPDLVAGDMAFGAGPMAAASDVVKITITGEGGHGARPHLTVDPLPIAAQVISALQHIVSRQVNPTDSAVITIGTIQAGTAANIIPSKVVMKGTVRTLDPQLRQHMPERIRRIVEGVSHAMGADCHVEYIHGYPVVDNDAKATDKARKAAKRALGATHIHEQIPTMIADDFSYFLHQVPGNFARLGTSFPEESRRFPVHNPRFEVDEACLKVGIAFFLSLILGSTQEEHTK